MVTRIAINGLGRIGRCILRAIAECGRDDIVLVAVNGPSSSDALYHLIKYDSVHGTFHEIRHTAPDQFDIGKGAIQVFHERDPHALPWGKLGIDVVLECTGKFNSRDAAYPHITAGAKKVIISAPAAGVDATIVYGVNHRILTAKHEVISIGSCTTNGLAPLAKTLHDAIGIESGFMTTIHAYTNDQNIIDSSHKDKRRARAAGLSLIPTTTGAAKALGLVIPELAGKLDGTSIRVPTPNVSMVDLCFNASRDTSVSEINEIMTLAATGSLKDILAVTNEELVSIDFNHDMHSSIFDATQTAVVGKRFCRVASWYDNEWGFSNRMLDTTVYLHSRS